MDQATTQTTPGGAARIAAPRKRRSLWWVVHQWAGLQASLFLSFVLLTGTLAVFSYELDWLTRPAMWAAPTSAAERISFGEAGTAIEEMYPDRRLNLLNAPLHPAATYDAFLERADGSGLFTHVYVHPRTGEVTGEGGWLGVQRFLRSTHRHLMLPVKWGVIIVSVSALFLLISLVTSFKVYKKWWRGFARLPQGKTARAWVGDAHRIMGVWSLWFVVAMIVTSAWYFAEQVGGAAPTTYLEQSALTEVEPDTARPASANEALDLGMARLAALQPDFRPTMVLWPTESIPYFQVRGHADRAILVRPRANTVRIDPETGQLVSQTDARALSAHQRIAEASDPLHFGTLGGYWTQAIWFVFGAALTALSMTGVAIYAMRIRKEIAETKARRPGLRAAWLAMGWARWLALGLVLLPFVLAPFVM